MKPAPVILVSPLDWGLGHATRCIPLINRLIGYGATVMVAAHGDTATLLKEAFPDITIVPFKGYNVRYHATLPAGIKLMFSAWRILMAIAREHRQIKNIVQQHKVDAIISDNRYGLWYSKVYCVFITHQLNIISPFLPRLINPALAALVRYFVKKFDECWIPDYQGKVNISGKLSHGRPIPVNARFIGPLSRFRLQNKSESKVLSFDLVAIVSGPEPQRTIFKNRLLEQLPIPGVRSLVISGIPGNTQIAIREDGLYEAGHLDAETLFNILASKPVVICRAGYSTLMDIEVTGNPALLIPTPGQTEQQYLAQRLSAYPGFIYQPQNKISLSAAYSILKHQLPPQFEKEEAGEMHIPELIERLKNRN